MAPHWGHGARRTAHRTAHGGVPRHTSSANNTQISAEGHRTSTRQEGDRARETQRKRDHHERRNEMKVPRSSSSTVPLRGLSHLADRVTYGHGGGKQGSVDYGDIHNLPPRPQQGRSLQQRITRNDGSCGDGGPVQPISLNRVQPVQAEHFNTDTRDDTGTDFDDFADLFGTESPPPRPPRQPINTKPIQYASSHHFPFNLHLHPPRHVQPATRREPIRIVNSWTPHEPDIDGPTPSLATQPYFTSPTKAPEAKARPARPYKGNDPIKRLVQNKKLQHILSGRPLPKPRKKADRMVLKCAGKQEFR